MDHQIRSQIEGPDLIVDCNQGGQRDTTNECCNIVDMMERRYTDSDKSVTRDRGDQKGWQKGLE